MIRALRLTYVPRWAIVPMRRHQSVAEHSFRVSIIAGAMATKLGFGPALVNNLMAAAILHDQDEAMSGDIPKPYKVAGNQGLYRVVPPSNAMEAILKVADRYETVTWAKSWGNGSRIPGVVASVEAELGEAVDKACHLIPDFLDTYRWVCAQVEEEE